MCNRTLPRNGEGKADKIPLSSLFSMCTLRLCGQINNLFTTETQRAQRNKRSLNIHFDRSERVLINKTCHPITPVILSEAKNLGFEA